MESQIDEPTTKSKGMRHKLLLDLHYEESANLIPSGINILFRVPPFSTEKFLLISKEETKDEAFTTTLITV